MMRFAAEKIVHFALIGLTFEVQKPSKEQ